MGNVTDVHLGLKDEVVFQAGRSRRKDFMNLLCSWANSVITTWDEFYGLLHVQNVGLL